MKSETNIHPIFAPALQQFKPAPSRGDRQRQIEEALAGFSMDAIEAQEILAAYEAGLKGRYDEPELSDVLWQLYRLKEALEELERTVMCPVAKEDLAEWAADQAQGNDE